MMWIPVINSKIKISEDHIVSTEEVTIDSLCKPEASFYIRDALRAIRLEELDTINYYIEKFDVNALVGLELYLEDKAKELKEKVLEWGKNNVAIKGLEVTMINDKTYNVAIDAFDKESV